MSVLQVTNVLQAFGVLALASFVVFYILRSQRLDNYRQQLFALRDEFFDYAADGHIAFDDEAYVLLRLQMNSMIRFAHQLSLFRALMTGAARLTFQPRPLEWNAAWANALKRLENEDVRLKLKAFHEASMMLAVKHLLVGSPVLWLLMLLSAVFLLCRGAFAGMQQLFSAASQQVFSGPLDQRFLEEEAVCSGV